MEQDSSLATSPPATKPEDAQPSSSSTIINNKGFVKQLFREAAMCVAL